MRTSRLLRQIWDGRRIVILDLETTGLPPRNPQEKFEHRIVEICALEMINFELTGRSFNKLVNPRRKIPIEASEIHGIYDRDIPSIPKNQIFRNIKADMLEFIGNDVIVAHNTSFDRQFINYQIGRADQILPKSQWICTMGLARKILKLDGKQSGPSLDYLCDIFELDCSCRMFHRADKDALILAKILIELKKRKFMSES